MRRVDKLGRIVIPLELREKHGLSEGREIEFIDAGEGIVVKASEPLCRICRTKIDSDSEMPVCCGCIQKILEKQK